ncbi:MAG: hypothetical protein ACLFTV_04785, partial [Desulfococcaceae bacterium]
RPAETFPTILRFFAIFMPPISQMRGGRHSQRSREQAHQIEKWPKGVAMDFLHLFFMTPLIFFMLSAKIFSISWLRGRR